LLLILRFLRFCDFCDWADRDTRSVAREFEKWKVRKMKPGEELPVIREWYELMKWLMPKINKFPRDQKFLLGDRIQSLMLDVLDDLIEAKFRRDRLPMLDRVNIELEKLRFLLRLCFDLGLLTAKVVGESGEKLLQIGTQIGGWRRAAESRGRP
jgi:hypothetical protein